MASASASAETNICSGTSSNLTMLAASAYIPKYNPSKPLGEDAHFLLPEWQALGVADGVGGFAYRGIDSGEYSRLLMRNTALCIQQQDGPIDPRRALYNAFLETPLEGASTACVLSLHRDSLNVVNIGDSGFVHFRGGKVVYKSPSQQHSFNCPYQLEYGNEMMDLADDIKRVVVPGDIIVVGTDGLFDNVHNEELEALVGSGQIQPERLAWEIAGFALVRANDKKAFTPFAWSCLEAGFVEMQGGKYDDITVIVAFIL